MNLAGNALALSVLVAHDVFKFMAVDMAANCHGFRVEKKLRNQ